MMIQLPVSKAKLAWQCRRGMLELDVLLQGFLQAEWDRLSSQERADFARLLEEADPDLLVWLVGKEKSARADLELIIQRILLYANH